MTVTDVTPDSVGSGVRVPLDAPDDLVVAAGVTVASTDRYGVAGGGTDVDVTALGTATGLFAGVSLGSNPNGENGHSLKIGADGWVQGSSHGATITGHGSSVVNEGTLVGDIDPGLGNDRLDKRDVVVSGDVSLGGGDDLCDGRRGGLVTGTIHGDAGNDVVRPGSEVEDIDGGDGLDMLDFRGMGGVRVSLLDDSGTGWAEGDGHAGFVVVLGSRAGADRIEVQTAAFGSSLAAGDAVFGTLSSRRFQSRADNLAQDSNDRFIFRTTDATLCWAPDGAGAQAPVLLADLQAGATMTSADILLVA